MPQSLQLKSFKKNKRNNTMGQKTLGRTEIPGIAQRLPSVT